MIIYSNKKIIFPVGIGTAINTSGECSIQPLATVNYNENGSYEVIPSAGYEGLGKVKVNVDVPEPESENLKVTTITGNGQYEITPDTGYASMKKVLADVQVPIPRQYYATLEKVYDYLYDAEYAFLDYDYAYEYFLDKAVPYNAGSCTSVRSGSKYGRNLDWLYSNEVDYIIRTENTIGIAGGISGLTKAVVEADPYNELYHILPFFMQDGINKAGVFANINVVSYDAAYGKTSKTIPMIDEELEICALMVVRYVLDNFEDATSAVEFLRDYAGIYMPQALSQQNYEVHYMIGDNDNTYVVEFINNRVNIIENNVLTNFYLTGTIPNEDGKFYSIIDVPEQTPSLDNGLKALSSGVERYNYVISALANSMPMRTIMNGLLYTKTYSEPEGPNFWYSEYVGGQLTIDSAPEQFTNRILTVKSQYQNRDRNIPITWQTTHSCVYDLSTLSLNILTQESQTYNTVLEKSYEEGYADGEAAQKARLSSGTFTQNGTYTREDGWNNVTVNVDTGCDLVQKVVDIYSNGRTILNPVDIEVPYIGNGEDSSLAYDASVYFDTAALVYDFHNSKDLEISFKLPDKLKNDYTQRNNHCILGARGFDNPEYGANEISISYRGEHHNDNWEFYLYIKAFGVIYRMHINNTPDVEDFIAQDHKINIQSEEGYITLLLDETEVAAGYPTMVEPIGLNLKLFALNTPDGPVEVCTSGLKFYYFKYEEDGSTIIDYTPDVYFEGDDEYYVLYENISHSQLWTSEGLATGEYITIPHDGFSQVIINTSTPECPAGILMKTISENGNYWYYPQDEAGVDYFNAVNVVVEVPSGPTPTYEELYDTVSANGTYDYYPSQGYDALSGVHINVNVDASINLQTKTAVIDLDDFSSNINVVPDSSYDGLSRVTISRSTVATQTNNILNKINNLLY